MATITKPQGALVDLTKCIGCRGCQITCKSWNQRSTRKTEMSGNFTSPGDMNSETYTLVKFVEAEKDAVVSWDFIKVQCMHCKNPACASACPVGAFTKTPAGPVTYEPEKCIGCRYCMMACPFQVPKYEWDKKYPVVQKCTFCAERIADGMEPACVKTCPPNAIIFGDHDKILAEAERRIKEHPGKYVDHIYGKEEAGGTAWMYLSSVPFETLGFKAGIPKSPLPDLTWASLSKIPYAVGGLAVILSAIAFIRNRGNSDSAVPPDEKGKEG
ncbi:MAG: 4Fe-4S dicluster domain-containing protein [Thermodesulfovibrionales bacterium]